jgi:hypothetical protein
MGGETLVGKEADHFLSCAIKNRAQLKNLPYMAASCQHSAVSNQLCAITDRAQDAILPYRLPAPPVSSVRCTSDIN